MKTIKSIVLSVVAMFAATGFSFSQTYTITPNDTFELTGYMEDLQTLTISQLNTTNDSIFLKWEKVSVTIPANWEATVCDNRSCYAELVDSGTMNAILPTEAGFLLLHITAHVNYSTAIIRYAVWDIVNPSARDTVTFIMTVSEPSAINETNKNAFRVFPNPANDYMNICSSANENCRINIFNSAGRKIYSSFSSADFKLSTANWLNEVYMLSMTDQGNNIITKKIIVQH